MRPVLPIVALLSSACVDSLDKPFLGDCAEYPDGAFTFGEIGIGTCLSGPVDVRFLEDDGVTWLAVSNADPYLNFTSGSVLLVDWGSVDFDRAFNFLDDLRAFALPTPRFNGQIGVIDERDLLLVPNRLSEEAVTRTSDDRAWLVDVSNPEAPALWEPNAVLGLQDDPYLVEIDEDEDIAWVGNLTDHSISLFDLDSERIAQIDIAPRTAISDPAFVDADASGSLATLDDIAIVDREVVAPDLWTLTFVEKLVRLWVPTLADEGLGLVRWTGGDEDFVPSGLGVELDPDDEPTIGSFADPFVAVLAEGQLQLFFEDGGVIRSLSSTRAAGDWTTNQVQPFGGQGTFADVVAGPSVVGLSPTTGGLFFHGRPGAGGPASIGLATTEDGLSFGGLAEPVVTDPAGVLSFEQPFVRDDEVTNGFRMWMSVFDGTTWTIGLSESEDGFAWSAPEEVLALDGLHAAAPAVDYVNGRYLMYFTLGDDLTWTHAVAWSYDGRTWFDPTPVVDSEVPFVLDEPPRAALQLDPTDAWRVAGLDEGQLDTLVPAGFRFVSSTQGFAFTIADGQEAGDGLFPDGRSANGLAPGSVALVDGLPTLYVTAVGADQRSRVGVIRPVNDGFAVLETNVIPAGEGGNVAGVSDPVVVQRDGAYTMFYAATDADGVTSIRRATSDDGRSFEPIDGPALVTPDDWDDVQMLPHSVEELGDGGVRLWYGGFDGNRWRIGAATADDLLGAFTADPGPLDPWQLAPGPPGSFDDSGVKDPMVFEADGVTQMYYAGFDGLEWHVGHAVLDGGTWIRRTDPASGLSIPAMSGLDGSFSAAGVDRPVLQLLGGDPILWYAGSDTFEPRLGRADPQGEVVFPEQRFPTPGDTLVFDLVPGGPGESNIELAQQVEAFSTSGVGMSEMALDADRGFLYVTSKLANFLYVIDVRDDTSGVLDDANYLDIEALVGVQTELTPIGFRDVVVDRVRDRLYLTSVEPEGLVVLDLDDIVDNGEKEVIQGAAVWSFPMLDADEDAGVITTAEIGGNGMALSPDGDLLLVPHLRDNSLWAFDLSVGPFGEPVAYLPNVGENPHQVRISPDGRFALVVNLLGEVDHDDVVNSTIAVVDIDPASETYLEIVTWLVNR